MWCATSLYLTSHTHTHTLSLSLSRSLSLPPFLSCPAPCIIVFSPVSLVPLRFLLSFSVPLFLSFLPSYLLSSFPSLLFSPALFLFALPSSPCLSSPLLSVPLFYRSFLSSPLLCFCLSCALIDSLSQFKTLMELSQVLSWEMRFSSVTVFSMLD